MNPWTQNIWMLTNVVDEMGGWEKSVTGKKENGQPFRENLRKSSLEIFGSFGVVFVLYISFVLSAIRWILRSSRVQATVGHNVAS